MGLEFQKFSQHGQNELPIIEGPEAKTVYTCIRMSLFLQHNIQAMRKPIHQDNVIDKMVNINSIFDVPSQNTTQDLEPEPW